MTIVAVEDFHGTKTVTIALVSILVAVDDVYETETVAIA
jgi:hypothetical protein